MHSVLTSGRERRGTGSNLRVYLAIAEEAAAESKRLTDEATTPRGDGGFVVRLDPEQRSFKHSLIAIAFAGMYLEAIRSVTKALGR